jgi:hypothetical protein
LAEGQIRTEAASERQTQREPETRRP